MDIKDVIPQRPPFLFIDEIKAVEPGVGADTTKLVTINEWYFRGQPNDKIAPMFMLLEMMAQTGALAILSDQAAGKNVLFGGVKAAEYTVAVHPGDQLDCHVALLKQRHGIGIGSGEIKVDGQVVFSATLIFAIVETEE